MYHNMIPYLYIDSSYRSLSGILPHLCHEDRSFPRNKAWGPVGGKGGACCSLWQQGVEVFFSRVCKIWFYFCVEIPFMPLLHFLSSRYFISLWLRYDQFYLYHSVIPYVYVDSSYRSISGVLLHLCQEDRSSLGRKACDPVGGKSGACCSLRQQGVEVFFSRVCKIWSYFCLEDPFMSLFALATTVIVCTYLVRKRPVSYESCVTPYVYVDSS